MGRHILLVAIVGQGESATTLGIRCQGSATFFFIMHVSFPFGSTKMDYIYTFNVLCVVKALTSHLIGPTQCCTGI